MSEKTLEHKIFELFIENNKEIYAVGGVIRDRLLQNAGDLRSEASLDAKNSVNSSIAANDLDFATNALPNETFDILQHAGYHPHKVGWVFGTIGIIDNNYEIHVTTYRKNEDYQRDNRNPVVEWGKSIEEDLTRRDFTCNAIAVSFKGEIIDPFRGVEHIKQKLLETPINANIAFSDDPLRMLRCIRFKAKLGFNYSEQVKQALYDQAHRLLVLSRERIQEELNKILMTDDAASALEDLVEYKLLNYFIPELTVLETVEQDNRFHHKNAWLHTVGVLQNIPKDLILRYAAIFHDIAKPYVLSNNDGEIHFYCHEELGAMMTYSILQRLGSPKQWIKDISYLVRHHMRANTYEYDWSDSAVRRFIRDTGEYCDKLLALSRADITSHNPTTIKKHLDCLNDLERRIEELKNFKELKCPVSGLAVMEYFDLPPCKKVGEIKDLVLNAILNGELKMDDTEETMLGYAKEKLEECVKSA